VLSNSPNRILAATFTVVVLAGCASTAPELPRYSAATAEAGYATPVVDLNTRARLIVVRPVWDSLNAQERERLALALEIKVLEVEQYGTVTDVQGADQSTAGTNAGASIGGAVANAAYIDTAINSGNYSAKTQLAAGILGAVLGSTLDRKAEQKFQFRYTVQLGDGDVKYFDEFKSTQFRHSVGVCVLLPELALVSQQVCKQNVASVRERYLK
jgi:outer membrane lipoprotein SlyB